MAVRGSGGDKEPFLALFTLDRKGQEKTPLGTRVGTSTVQISGPVDCDQANPDSRDPSAVRAPYRGSIEFSEPSTELTCTPSQRDFFAIRGNFSAMGTVQER